MSREKTLTVQRTIYLTPEVWDHLGQLARKRGRDCNENVLIRESIRLFIDSQSDVIGSRRHFQKSLQEHLDQFEQRTSSAATRNTQMLLFYLQIIIQLLAFGIAHLITGITRKEVTAQQLIQKAVIDARREEAIFVGQVQSVREMSLPERHE